MANTYTGTTWPSNYGWTCSRCKAWVEYNASHSCPNNAMPQVPQVTQVTPSVLSPYEATLQRIAGALERIAQAMDKPDADQA